MLRVDLNKFKQVDAPAPVRGIGCSDDSIIGSSLDGVINGLDKCPLVHWYSYGDWSMHQLLKALLQKTGPADVLISSYAFSETPTRVIAVLKNDGLIKRLDCVIDSRVETRTAGSMQLLRGICDGLALVATHAKVTLIKSSNMVVTVVGSANYTENKRYEAGIVTTNESVFNFHLSWIQSELQHGAK
jgi:hypothetical protein